MSAPKNLLEKIKTSRAELEEAHLAGTGGLEICKRWSGFVDSLIAELIESNGEEKSDPSFALVALGGYGREDLNPCSDIDLLFLFEGSFISAKFKPIRIIPTLWDLGFKVGHSTRSIQDCLQIAQQDSISKTSMIEARFLLGDREMFNLFAYRFKTKVITSKPLRFLREKSAETEIRHNKFSNTLFLTEPDIKESPGGLRDYHLALWIAAARYGVRRIAEIQGRGLMDQEETSAVFESVNFLLRMRNDMHFIKDEPKDVLDYALQPQIAKRLGYGEGDHAVIKMMHDYYRAADTVFRFGRSITEQAMRYRSKTQMFLLRLRHRQLAESVFAGPDEIFVKGLTAVELSAKPGTVFEIFRLIVEKELKPAPGLRRMLEAVGTIWKKETPDAKSAADGLRSVLDSPDPFNALSLMRDSKVLTAVIPEFHKIRYLTPFDLYHKFTVDDHSFRAIREFDNLKRNESVECRFLRIIYEEEGRKDLIRLTLLLHDIGKGDGTHSDEEEIDPAILERLGYGKEEIEVVVTLVRLHLLMNNVAQRRDSNDKQTIEKFCAEVGNEAMLRRLYLVTYADTRSVGPGIWNSWKAELLKNVFTRAVEFFDGKEGREKALPSRYVPDIKMPEKAKAFMEKMPDRYFLMRKPEEIEADVAFIAKYFKGERVVVVEHRAASETEPGEIMIVTKTHLGLMHEIVGTLFSKNIDILQSQILTHTDGIAVDYFRVNGPDGKPITDEAFWSRVKRELKGVLGGKKNVEELIKERSRITVPPKDVPQMKTEVKVLNDVSFDHTVVEITARDKMSLLYEITRTFSELKIDIISARVSTEGHKAVDTFYISEPGGQKVISPERVAEMKRALLFIIGK